MDRYIPPDRVEYVAVAARQVLLSASVDGLTMRALASKVNCSPSTLVHRFGSRSVMLAHIAAWLGRQWLDVVSAGAWQGSPSSALDGHEQRGWQLRAWLAMCELGRGDPRIGEQVADIERSERRELGRYLPRGVDDATSDLWVAVVRGLHHDLGAGVDALPLERARAALDRFATLLSSDLGSEYRA